MRKICVITGTRAEWGLLSPLTRLIADSPDCRLQIIATNMHLLEEYGYTYREIERDGFTIDEKVYMVKPTDNAGGVLDSMAEELSGMNRALQRLQPDIAVILGDRYEMIVAAIACLVHRIPIAHLHGGEITEGAYDDSIRHCISKLSHLHFTSTEEYRRRVIQLGEDPQRVFYVGAIGVENIKTIGLIPRDEVERELGIDLSQPTVLATYHPVTLGTDSAKNDIDAFLSALEEFPDMQYVFTMPNSDQGGGVIRKAIQDFCVHSQGRARYFNSLGIRIYLSLMQYAVAVIGNSSSGIIEVPSAHIPTLNIGDRQKGRVHGKSVIDCRSDRESIIEGLRCVFSDETRQMARTESNPYDRENTARNIFKTISTYPLEDLARKRFYDLPLCNNC